MVNAVQSVASPSDRNKIHYQLGDDTSCKALLKSGVSGTVPLYPVKAQLSRLPQCTKFQLTCKSNINTYTEEALYTASTNKLGC